MMPSFDDVTRAMSAIQDVACAREFTVAIASGSASPIQPGPGHMTVKNALGIFEIRKKNRGGGEH